MYKHGERLSNRRTSQATGLAINAYPELDCSNLLSTNPYLWNGIISTLVTCYSRSWVLLLKFCPGVLKRTGLSRCAGCQGSRPPAHLELSTSPPIQVPYSPPSNLASDKRLSSESTLVAVDVPSDLVEEDVKTNPFHAPSEFVPADAVPSSAVVNLEVVEENVRSDPFVAPCESPTVIHLTDDGESDHSLREAAVDWDGQLMDLGRMVLAVALKAPSRRHQEVVVELCHQIR